MAAEWTIVKKEGLTSEYQLTVVTVCRNMLPELRETLRSVLAQKERGEIRMEHIVIDGASTDGTAEWLAEMQARGSIETFVSEPDCGIYDAMNKGINLARGEVVMFLNAGDRFTECSLLPCITPILEGRTDHTAAVARTTRAGKTTGKAGYNPALLYIVTPCCHQAYFARTALYRRCGGYAAQKYRCCADGDAMARHTNLCGEAAAVETEAVYYDLDGFSGNTAERFLDEWLLFTWEHRAQAAKRAAADARTAAAWAQFLVLYGSLLRDWQQRYRKLPAELTEHYAAVCRQAAELPNLLPCVRRFLLDTAERRVPYLQRHTALPAVQKITTYYRARYCGYRLRNPGSGARTALLKLAVSETRLRLGQIARTCFGYHR